MKKCKYDWNEIQNYYNDNHVWDDIKKKFGCSDGGIFKAIKTGKLKLRTRQQALELSIKRGRRSHSQETKNKLSKIQLDYLRKNPDKVPYLINHSSKKSWPEQLFENALNTANIKGWFYHYRNGIYQYDFAFPDLKIDVEIDGNTHNTDKVKEIDSRRDQFSKLQGWTVLRFPAGRVNKNVMLCIDELKNILWTLSIKVL